MESMLARQEARNAGADEALFLNEKGQVTEASGSNVFVVANGIVKTPRLRSGILPGITRAAVFEVARQIGVRIAESNLPPGQLLAADEVFLTNSLIEVMPVTTIAGQAIGGGAPGAVTKQLMEEYRRLVFNELHAR